MFQDGNEWTENPPSWLDENGEGIREEVTFVASVYDESRISRSVSGTPSVSLRVEGSAVVIFLVLEFPTEYPLQCVRIALRSPNASAEVLGDIQDEVQREAEEQFAVGSLSTIAVIGRVTEIVSNLPLVAQAVDFCCCVHCNTRRIRKGQDKVIQAAKKLSENVYECLHCRGTDCIHIPSARQSVGKSCTFCFCEDNPLITIECGCISCVSCFKTFADIATGSNELKQHSRTREWGVACPNHPTVVIREPGLYKLCQPRCFLRFNNFALAKLSESLKGYSCPRPGCNAVPLLSDVTGGFMKCIACRAYSCTKCFETPIACTCEDVPASSTVRREVHLTKLHASSSPCAPVAIPPEEVLILLFFGSSKKQIPVNTRMTGWYDRLLQEIQYDTDKERNRENWPFFVFCGGLLHPRRTLGEYGVYLGSIIYAVEYFPQRDSRERKEEEELFRFRRSIGQEGGASDVEKNGKKLFKNCPFCTKPVFHYRNHGCHHIGAFGSCCGKDWCYACRGPWPCQNGCKLFCWEDCDCPPCPDCAPMMPCMHCSGCDQCGHRMGEVLNFQ